MDKFQYNLEYLRQNSPRQSKFNKTKMLTSIGKGDKWFMTRVKENRLEELPKFKVRECTRKGKPYFEYEFDILDIAEFLAK